MHSAITDLFDRYEHQTNAGLEGRPDIDALSDLYDDAFVAASPAGIMIGKNDEAFAQMLIDGFDRNREIGAQNMEVRALRIEPIDDLHALAYVGWRATYDKNGTAITIDFTNAYLTRTIDGRARTFGWVIGDENAALRKHGII